MYMYVYVCVCMFVDVRMCVCVCFYFLEHSHNSIIKVLFPKFQHLCHLEVSIYYVFICDTYFP